MKYILILEINLRISEIKIRIEKFLCIPKFLSQPLRGLRKLKNLTILILIKKKIQIVNSIYINSKNTLHIQDVIALD